MNTLNRRQFLKNSLLTTASIALLPRHTRAREIGANDEIRYAVVGFGGRGRDHIKEMHDVPGTRMVALCDVDSDILAREVKQCEYHSEKVQGYTNIRKLLANPEIDVVTFATPNHWHSLGPI